jgi:hypothetical protein
MAADHHFWQPLSLFNQLVARFVDRESDSGAEISINGSGIAQICAAVGNHLFWQ